MKKTSQRGFTLIELLVVIAIIGILASVVLASLNSARNKGADAAAISSITNMRAQAELVYDSVSPNSYATVCADTSVVTALTQAASSLGGTYVAASGDAIRCFSDATTYSIEAKIKAGATASTWNYFCVDSSGKSIKTSTPAVNGTGAWAATQDGSC
jgi:prepilin-type N-terminal cleavage/methylation domain-containing protein